MPRRKLTTINLKELETYPALIEELRNNPAYVDKDLSTLKLTVLDSYEATIKEVDKAINHLQHYVAAKKNEIETFQGEQLINRVRLARMLGHISLDFSAQDKDKLTNVKMVQIAKKYMSKMGITDTQYIIGRHYDKEYPHIHIDFNRRCIAK